MLVSNRNPPSTKTYHLPQKPKFQTKIKPRTRNISDIEIEPIAPKKHIHTQIQTQPTRTPQPYLLTNNKQCLLDNNPQDPISTKLQKINFSHHNPNVCVCALCTCGRHLCQLHSIKPDLTKNTIYKKDYLRKKPIKNRINISQEYDRLRGPCLQPNTTYQKDFNGRSSKVDKFRPQDNLKLTGPCPQLTSYSSNFPGHHGQNQYVKPTDKHTRGDFPLRSHSTYAHSFTGNQRKKDQWDRTPDNLKTGTNWFGTTTYGNSFKKPKQDDYSAKYKVSEKLQTNPNFIHQYETMYKNDFVTHPSKVCPAKLKLQTKAKGQFCDQKDNFSQNTDFKSLDPKYRSFSSSQYRWI